MTNIIDKIKNGISEFESLAPDFRVFMTGVHSFIYKLKVNGVIEDYALTLTADDKVFISIRFVDGGVFEETFNYKVGEL